MEERLMDYVKECVEEKFQELSLSNSSQSRKPCFSEDRYSSESENDQDETDAGAFFYRSESENAQDETDAGGFYSPAPAQSSSQSRHTLDSKPRSTWQNKVSATNGQFSSPHKQADKIPRAPLATYDMSKSSQGCFMIVDAMNNDISRKDCRTLEKLGKKLGFDPYIKVKNIVYEHEGQRLKEDLKEDLFKLGKASHEKYNCFFVVVLARKDGNGVTSFGNNHLGIQLKLEDFIEPFIGSRAPTLNTKPKLVFVHAPVRKLAQPVDEGDAEIDDGQLPNHADFFITVCQPEDQFSYGDQGSYFIRNLYKVLGKYSGQNAKEINQLMQVVNRSTKEKVKQKKQADSKSKQAPTSGGRFCQQQCEESTSDEEESSDNDIDVPQDEEDFKEMFWCRSQLTKRLLIA